MNHIGTREIATERLTLRRFEIEDAENMFYNWANDPEVTKYLTWPAHESVDTTENYFKKNGYLSMTKKIFISGLLSLMISSSLSEL